MMPKEEGFFMIDPRIEKLAYNLIHYSCMLQKGEKVLIETIELEIPLIKALIIEAYQAEAVPFVSIKSPVISREVLLGATEDQMKMMASYESARMRDMNAYIGVRSSANTSELSDVPEDRMELYSKFFLNEVHGKIRVPNTKWVVLRYPSSSMAQLAKMSTDAFEDFYFSVCNLNYSKMSAAMDPLVDLMNNTERVRIIGQNTDLSFLIKGMKGIKCDGRLNIPDGEIFTAPVRDSVNGVISYNTPSEHNGFTYENIRFTFRNGKIIQAEANDTEKINKVLDTDEGARYIGEFAIGVNPYITVPMKDTLFDEKISGSIHLTPGSCYDECNNGNQSAIHWDLVYIQTPEYGGGEIYFDDRLIRKDGIFTIPELQCLNPDQLK